MIARTMKDSVFLGISVSTGVGASLERLASGPGSQATD